MITFAHMRNTRNRGDLASTPGLYFDFGAHRFADIRERHAGVVIYGGGAIGQWLARQRATGIAWGVGSTVHGATRVAGTVPEGMRLYGSRDDGLPGAIWTPCASCMSPLFDASYEIRHEAVLFTNGDRATARRYPVNVPGLPHKTNHGSLEEIIAFLGSADLVVTNSYHGAYWATLLGRRVVVVGAYSSKFYGFRHQPSIGGDWSRARAHPEALDECRIATREFADRVRECLRL